MTSSPRVQEEDVENMVGVIGTSVVEAEDTEKMADANGGSESLSISSVLHSLSSVENEEDVPSELRESQFSYRSETYVDLNDSISSLNNTRLRSENGYRRRQFRENSSELSDCDGSSTLKLSKGRRSASTKSFRSRSIFSNRSSTSYRASFGMNSFSQTTPSRGSTTSIGSRVSLASATREAVRLFLAPGFEISNLDDINMDENVVSLNESISDGSDLNASAH